MAMLVAPLYNWTIDNGLTCPNCGIDTAEDMDAIYATFYPPGSGPLRLEAPTCGPCAARIRAEAMQGSRKLEDRREGLGATDAAPNQTYQLVWQAMGIDPNRG